MALGRGSSRKFTTSFDIEVFLVYNFTRNAKVNIYNTFSFSRIFFKNDLWILNKLEEKRWRDEEVKIFRLASGRRQKTDISSSILCYKKVLINLLFSRMLPHVSLQINNRYIVKHDDKWRLSELFDFLENKTSAPGTYYFKCWVQFVL